MGAVVSATGLSALSIMTGLPQDPARMATAPEPASPERTGPLAPPIPAAETSSAPAVVANATPETSTPPQAEQVEVPAGSVFNAAREDGQAVLPQGDGAPQVAMAPVLDSAPQQGAAPLPSADRDPAAQPQADQGGGTLAAPPMAGDAPAMAALSDSTSPRSTAPAEPPSPAPREVASAPAISPEPTQPDQAQAAPDQSGVDRPAPAEAPGGLAALVPMPEPMPEPTPDPQSSPRRQSLPVIEPAPPAVTPEQIAPVAPVAVPETAPVIRPAIGTPATSLVDRPAPDAETAAPSTARDAVIPLRRNALPFEDPENRPRLAIVLIDRGDSPIGIEALRDFPYPLTFAVDASRPDAADASARYRAAGFEVVALIDLAPESTPQDAEVAIEVSLSAVPDAVAVLEGDAAGFQFSRQVSDQVSAILGQRGYGLVMLPNGLNTAQKLASKSGVPSATVFRDFDGAGQDAAAIRRFLDQGAFKAGQQANGLPVAGEGEGVIMMGRLRPDTISALLLWGLQDRAQRVALAPVSAVLSTAE